MIWSVAAALLAAGVSWRMIESERREFVKTTQMTTILKARKFIPAAKTISSEWVDEWPIPEAYVPLGAFRSKSELLDAAGRPRFAAAVGLSKGALLTRSVLSESAGLGGLAWIIDPGRMAFSLRLNLEQGVAGWIQPGDFVNVFCLTQDKSSLLLSRARVVAVGNRAWGGPPSDFSKTMDSEPLLVTLMVDLPDALALTRAVGGGSVSLALASALPDINQGGR